MNKSISFNLILLYSFLIFLTTSLLFIFSFLKTKKFFYRIIENKLEEVNLLLYPQVENFIFKNDLSSLQKFVETTKKTIKTRITIIDQNGTVLADSHHNPKDMENHSNREEIKDAKIKGSSSEIRYSKTLGLEMLYVATFFNNKKPIFIRTSYPLGEIYNLFSDLIKQILVIFIFILLIALISILVITKIMFIPITHLIDATKNISQGNFETKIIFNKKNEFSPLVEHFNEMSETINNLVKQLTGQKIKLERLFNSIREGIIFIDKNGKILLSNENFNKIAGKTTVGKFYTELMLSSELNDVIKKFLQQKKQFTDEISIGDKTYLCSGSIVSDDEFIVLFYDITEYKNIQKLKKELTTNITHELKTPLTSIRGFADTLYEEIDSPQQKQYLEIIISNIRRMENIINDLIFISKLETENVRLEIEKIDIRNIIENILLLFKQKISQKNLKLFINIDENLPDIFWDRFKIEQMLVNLLDNAVKYTEKGSISISVYNGNNNTIIIKIEDTGIGIPPQYHQKVFERFFCS